MVRILLAILLLASPAGAETFTFSDTTDVDDAMIRSTSPDANFGARTEISTYWNGSTSWYFSLVRVRNVADSLGGGATVVACSLFLYCYYRGATANVYAYRVFKPHVEGILDGGNPSGNGKGATYNDWSADSKEWATAGCENADDGGSDNSGDGSGADRKATAEDVVSISSTNAWFGWDLTTLGQGWYAGTINEEGVILQATDEAADIAFRSSEYTENQPKWVFTYTVGAATAAQVIIVGGQ